VTFRELRLAQQVIPGTCAYVAPPTLIGNRPATCAIEDRGMATILRACGDPSAALDTILADTHGFTLDDPLLALN
jgi:hypothetical protein